jgi:hypothetical protein
MYPGAIFYHAVAPAILEQNEICLDFAKVIEYNPFKFCNLQWSLVSRVQLKLSYNNLKCKGGHHAL